MKFYLYIPSLSSGTAVLLRFNNASGSVYAWNTGAGSQANQTSIQLVGNTTAQIYMEGSIVNKQSNEKLLIANGSRHATGAGGAAIIDTVSGKWANTSSVISRIDIIATSNIGAEAELVVLGHD